MTSSSEDNRLQREHLQSDHLAEDNQEAISPSSTPSDQSAVIPFNSVSEETSISQSTESLFAIAISSNQTELDSEHGSLNTDTSTAGSNSSAIGSVVVDEEDEVPSSEEPVLEVRLSTRTTTSQSQNHLKGHPIVVVFTVNTLFGCIVLIMNAAITIFGMGIGVGLLLGESFRSPNSRLTRPAVAAVGENSLSNETAATAATAAARRRVIVTHTTTTSTSTNPSCGRVVRQQIRIQPPPNLSEIAATTMPAQ